MRAIRYGSFETNSSSTHAIVVPKQVDDEEYSLYDSLDHDYAFGREECRLCCNWDEKLAYVYMIIKDIGDKNQLDVFKDTITAAYITITHELKESADFTPKQLFDYLDRDGCDGNITQEDSFLVLKERYGNFVDHSYSLKDTNLIERLLNDFDFLKRFIFNKQSYITVGGDEYRGYNIKTIGFEYDYDERYYVNKEGNRPPKDWYDKNGRVKSKYWDKYNEEYNIIAGGFWDKLKEYEKDNDVYLKGN